MHFKCYTGWNSLPKSTAAIFSKAEKESLFFSQQWFENLIATALKDEHEVLFACVVESDGNKVLAILPLLKRDNKEWSSLSHSYSSLYTILLEKNEQTGVLNCLAQGLKQLPFTYLTLEPVAEDDKDINRLQQALEAINIPCYRNHRYYNWFHQIQGQSFAEYMEDRPSRVRNTVARKQRKLEREFNYEIRLHSDNNIERALSDYHDIYKVSWKANEQYEEIVKGLTGRFSKSGWTRLAILYIEGKPIAAHLWFVVGRKASIFRLVYDQDWKQYSPGTVLMAYLLEHVIDTDKVEEIDFLTGNDRYKQDWMSERRERWMLVCFNKPETEEKRSRFDIMTNGVRKLLKKSSD